MARITQARLELTRTFLKQFDALERKNTDACGWLMLKFSCSRVAAARLLHAVETNVTTKDVRGEGRYTS